MASRTLHSRAFTIVEMLVVISIIGVLIGLLVPSLTGIQKRSKKAREVNNIKQLGYAWALYAQDNADATIPAYLDDDPLNGTTILEEWDVVYQYPDNTVIPEDIAAPWTWRLMPYVDFNHDLVHGHLQEANTDLLSQVDEADEVALEPAFGYNGYYVGGYYELETLGSQLVAQPRFKDVRHANDNERLFSLPVKAISQVRRPDELIAFCSSGIRDPGIRKPIASTDPGYFLVVPPYLAEVEQWRTIAGETVSIEVVRQAPVPVGRYTGQAALVYPDGHVDRQGPSSLTNPKQWINAADQDLFGTNNGQFLHTEN
jgi:prepilin-type N-terminal cleavage/methylation domain-containing protein